MSTSASTSKCRVLTGATVSAPFSAEIKSLTASLAPRRPKLRAILGPAGGGGSGSGQGDNAPSRAYAQWTKKACDAVGIDFELVEVGGEGVGFGEVEEEILRANAEDEVDGIMVYYPCFGQSQDQYLQQVVSPFKDVEGMNFAALFKLYHNVRYTEPQALGISPTATLHPQRLVHSAETAPPGMVKAILPCTPLAIVKILEHAGVYDTALEYGDRAFGKVVTIINRSEVVGRPLAALLANDGARVFSIDIHSNQEFTRRRQGAATDADAKNLLLPRHVVLPTKHTLAECLAMSDVVVSGVPGDRYKVKTSELKEGAVVVNISDGNNFEDDVRSKASVHVATVGKVTIAMLQRNLLRLRGYRELALQAGPLF